MNYTHIFLFEEESLASQYGIGTYLQKLKEIFKKRENTFLHVIYLHSKGIDKYQMKSRDYGQDYYFPSPCVESQQHPTKKNEFYFRSIWILLFQEIKRFCGKNDKLVFQFNYHYEKYLIDLIKLNCPTSIIIFSIHYFNWALLFKGDIKKLRNILKNNNDDILEDYEKEALSYYNQEKCIFEKVDHIISLTRYTKQILINEYKINSDKISVIYNGIKDIRNQLNKKNKKEIRKELFINEDEKIILFVGRIHFHKGLETLIESIKFILPQINVRLIIVGEGDVVNFLKYGKKYCTKITFTGYLKKEELYKYYQIADVGVMPYWVEQCSYVAIEMMMFKLPIVFSSIPEFQEMFENNNVNIVNIINKNDERLILPQDLASTIIKVLENNQSSQELYLKYKQKFTINEMSRNMNVLIDSLI